MFQRLSILLILPLVVCLMLGPVFSAQARQRPKYLFKIGSLAPEGSVWAKRFKEFADEVEAKSNGEIGFKIYPGGVMGDDRAMYRKMRVGQLHGGGFTMTGISEVVNDFRVLGVPFLFSSYDEVDRVIARLWPELQKIFRAQDMEILAMSEVGFIYTMSTFPITTLADLKKSRSWVPDGDPVSAVLLETAGVNPVPLSIPDVMTSLQTGLVDTVYNSFYGSIVLQWFTRTRYITDVPFLYAYGGFVVDRKLFARLPAPYAEMMAAAAKSHFARLLQDTRQSNEESLAVLKDNGVSVLKATPVTQAQFQSLREETVAKLKGRAFSEGLYDLTVTYLNEYHQEMAGEEAPGAQ